MPYLVFYKPSSCQAKFVEVKGPSDSLSDKQIVWLHNLQKAGACVEVLHVSNLDNRAYVDDTLIRRSDTSKPSAPQPTLPSTKPSQIPSKPFIILLDD